MNNPYLILNIKQEADKKQVIQAQIIAMKEKKHSIQDIHMAVHQLLNPTKRLAADYLFPTKIKAKRPQKISIDIEMHNIKICEIDKSALDSLK